MSLVYCNHWRVVFQDTRSKGTTYSTDCVIYWRYRALTPYSKKLIISERNHESTHFDSLRLISSYELKPEWVKPNDILVSLSRSEAGCGNFSESKFEWALSAEYISWASLSDLRLTTYALRCSRKMYVYAVGKLRKRGSMFYTNVERKHRKGKIRWHCRKTQKNLPRFFFFFAIGRTISLN